MRANELMIGDWVNYCGEPFCIDYYHRITDTIGLKYKGKSPNFGDGVICAEDASPIPLTPEILEKNGFEFVNDSRIAISSSKLIDNDTSIHFQFYDKRIAFSNCFIVVLGVMK